MTRADKSMFTIAVLGDDPQGDRELVRAVMDVGFNAYFEPVASDSAARIHAMGADLVLLDMNRPAGCALDLLRQLCGDGGVNSRPVIVISCHDSLSTRLSCFVAGARRFMTRPVNPDDIDRHITSILIWGNAAQRLQTVAV